MIFNLERVDHELPLFRLPLPTADTVNAALLQDFQQHRDDPDLRRSHLFGGRYENLYLPLARVPALAEVLAVAVAGTRQILGLAADVELRAGGWFNEMGPGQATSLHRHDDDDELMSAVYYVTVPADSGDLLIHAGERRLRIPPRVGHLVFFPPDLAHEVTENRSEATRLSIGINVGPVAG
ncbi:putative 2OG-Fe(II) oxygenase [Thiohalobacter sp. IOR34]|uniref:putative 2OG-Fe(II) oxygenase n=1 Tax=Thiohalobacter sp. IOR34 TaxID=3057176 RepID=UPI0025AF9A51|nr:2OG-Fe(II) oxygenase [Thiohalobacter sp. IOR34]WJW74407.1 putative 2OG-Fe(II) oxygenase [Thiohalobacter sp. IOR34]